MRETWSLSDEANVGELTPSQFFDRFRSSGSPETRLAAAVLEEAYECWTGRPRAMHAAGPGVARCLKAEAGFWLLEDKSDMPFSFYWVAEVLGCEVSWLRKLLRERRVPAKSVHILHVVRNGRLSARAQRRARVG